MASIDNAGIRAAAFAWLADQVDRHGDVLQRALLEEGFEFQGEQIRLVGPQGIFKPKALTDGPLSITTSPDGPYDDAFGNDGMLRYRYRRGSTQHRDNVGLRAAMDGRLPLVYFYGLVPGKYLPAWPVYVVADDPIGSAVSVAVDDARYMSAMAANMYTLTATEEQDTARRRYITAVVRVRMHQRSFRERVLEAYRRQCAFCRFRHEEMLDAAHIVADAHPEGEPTVQNGLALCTLHHSAFDRYFIGVRPDFVIEVRPDILAETDGPTLQHGIQALHGRTMELPRSVKLRPNSDLLAIRYKLFTENR
jgi:putative restriction endonuclease